MNKLTVTSSEVGGDNRGKRWKGSQGTCIKEHAWTKPKWGSIKRGVGRSGGWKMETIILEQQ